MIFASILVIGLVCIWLLPTSLLIVFLGWLAFLLASFPFDRWIEKHASRRNQIVWRGIFLVIVFPIIAAAIVAEAWPDIKGVIKEFVYG